MAVPYPGWVSFWVFGVGGWMGVGVGVAAAAAAAGGCKMLPMSDDATLQV
jgi:hypothetical protein